MIVRSSSPLVFSGGIFFNNGGFMTNKELYDIFTVRTTTIPPKWLYYQKLGQVLREMRTDANITPMHIMRDLDIPPDELREYESGMREISIYDLLNLLSYMENPQSEK